MASLQSCTMARGTQHTVHGEQHCCRVRNGTFKEGSFKFYSNTHPCSVYTIHIRVPKRMCRQKMWEALLFLLFAALLFRFLFLGLVLLLTLGVILGRPGRKGLELLLHSPTHSDTVRSQTYFVCRQRPMHWCTQGGQTILSHIHNTRA
jgi:hypothetical protein